MSSCFIIEFGGFEIDSGPQYVQGEFTDLFTEQDLIITNQGNESTYRYKISVSDLRNRLITIGFTQDNLQVALSSYLENQKDELTARLHDETYIKYFGEDYLSELRQHIEYLKSLNEDSITDLLTRCKKFEHGFYPDLGNHDLSSSELKLLDGLFNRDNSEIYFHPFNLYFLLSKIFSDGDVLEVDYTDLVYAGYYQSDESPIKYGYNEIVKNLHPDSLILGEKLDDEENEYKEFKEIKGNNAINSISKNIVRYVVAFLNTYGGSILWGITDNRKVKGIELNYNDRDSLKRRFYDALSTIEPNVNKDELSLKFRPIIHNGEVQIDLYCIEITVPKLEPNKMYFKKSGETWIRLDGVTKQLKGVELYDFIEARIKC